MKLKTLTAATAVVLAGLSGQAMATLTATDLTNGPFVAASNPVVDLYLSGASAPQRVLGGIAERIFTDNNAATKDFYVFYDNGVSGLRGNSYRAYQGRLNQAFGGQPVGTMVRINHRAKGGSVWGVDPVGRAHETYAATDTYGSVQVHSSNVGQSKGRIAWMPIVSANCGTPAASGRDFDCGEYGNDNPTLNPATIVDVNKRFPAGRVTDFGVSDVEPPMFKDPLNVEFGQSALANPSAVLSWQAVNGLLFGVAATNGADGVSTGTDGVPGTIPLNRAIVSALLNGAITEWTTLEPAATTNPQVVICRRVQGSGTQATFNAYFNLFPCNTGSIYGTGSTLALRMIDSAGYDDSTPGVINIDASLGLTVVENPSSGNVADCLRIADNGGTHSFVGDDGRTVNVNFVGSGYRAIGNLSKDTAETADWSFRTLSGVTANKANLISGAYDFWSELSMQYNSNTVLPGGTQFNVSTLASSWVSPITPAAQATRDFALAFRTLSGNPDVLLAISNVVQRDATVALPISYNPNETVAYTGSNVSRVTSFGNSCSPKRRIY